MAEASTTSAPKAACSHAPARECCSEKTFAYLFFRIVLAFLLIMPGIEKFKSALPPYNYKTSYWHGDGTDQNVGNWWKVSKPVYEFGGFNNPEVFGEKGANTIGWMFYYFSHALPYAMIAAGLLILLGFLNRLALFAGGFIWFSLAIGQMTLPDNATVFMLTFYTALYGIALALLKHNKFALTRF